MHTHTHTQKEIEREGGRGKRERERERKRETGEITCQIQELTQSALLPDPVSISKLTLPTCTPTRMTKLHQERSNICLL
jgi:hypothetical protein